MLSVATEVSRITVVMLVSRVDSGSEAELSITFTSVELQLGGLELGSPLKGEGTDVNFKSIPVKIPQNVLKI